MVEDQELFPASNFAVVDTVPEELHERIEREEEDRNLVTLEYLPEGEPKREVNAKVLGSGLFQEYLEMGEPITAFDGLEEADTDTLHEFVDSYVTEIYSEDVHADWDSVHLSGYEEGQVAVDLDLVYEPDFNGHSDVLTGTLTVLGTPDQEYLEDGEPVEEYVSEVEAALQ
jgi:hypothetical protein